MNLGFVVVLEHRIQTPPCRKLLAVTSVAGYKQQLLLMYSATIISPELWIVANDELGMNIGFVVDCRE
jgi:hypothetical protein